MLKSSPKRIAITCGSGYVPGINSIIAGATLAAQRLGIEVVGIHDGFDGLLAPDRYPDGGLVKLNPSIIENQTGATTSLLGTGARLDPFRVQKTTSDHSIEEADRSDELLELLRKRGIEAVIGIVGGSAVTGLHAMTVMLKLHRKGLRTICIPKSVENDVNGTSLAFGYNSILSHTTELLQRVRAAASDVSRVAVVEVPGQNAGWLALQSGMATCAEAVLIPEIPYSLSHVAAHLEERFKHNRRSALIVVAEGARPIESRASASGTSPSDSAMRKSLGPLSDPSFGTGARAIFQSGRSAEQVSLELQRLTHVEIMPMVLGQLVRGGAPSAVDLQLGLGYGAAAVRSLAEGQNGVMVSFVPPDLKLTFLSEAINKVRTIPQDSLFMELARSLGISLGTVND
jgi:ATP-dependent phosphofructokinase / diphosphate-dependent phosphofructokinase